MQANTNELVAVLSEGESQNESEFVLKARHNNLTVKEPCAICGFVDDFADWPYWIFLDGRYDSAVCHMCIEKHDPILLELVNYANLYRWPEYQKKVKHFFLTPALSPRLCRGEWQKLCCSI